MVYGADAMLPVEIDTPTWRRDTFSKEGIESFDRLPDNFFMQENSFIL
jgi:hypothetical protein